MTAIRPERLAAGQSVPEKTGPEIYAPNRSVPEKLGEVDQAAATAFEGEIREFVRRDVATLRRQRGEGDAAADPAAENLNALIRRVAGASMEESERVSRELAGYASLSHASMTAMKVIGDSLKQWKNAPLNHSRRSAS